MAAPFIQEHSAAERQNDSPDTLPPLQSGDRLTRAEFERRYHAYPDMKAELIEGVVYMPSPVSLSHGEAHAVIAGWLLQYVAATPGTRIADNATIRLDADNEVQPDAALWIEAGNDQVSVTDDGYLSGAPEMIVEVAVSSAAYDLHDKLHVYRRNGVQEYLVLLAFEQETVWYVLDEGAYRPLAVDDDGVLRSERFPGLHFDSERFWQRDLAGLLAVLQEGIKTAAHENFAAQLQPKQNE